MIQEKINDEFKKAFKEKNSNKLNAIRMLKTAITNKGKERGSESLSDDDVVSIIDSLIKQRKQSYDAYMNGNRPELAEREEYEISILKIFLPERMSEDEIEKEVLNAKDELNATSMKDMGKMMGYMKSKFGTKVNPSTLAIIIKKHLN